MKLSRRALSILSAGAIFVGGYELGVQREHYALRRIHTIPVADRMLDYNRFDIRFGESDRGGALYLVDKNSGNSLPLVSETERFLKVVQQHPRTTSLALRIIGHTPTLYFSGEQPLEKENK